MRDGGRLAEHPDRHPPVEPGERRSRRASSGLIGGRPRLRRFCDRASNVSVTGAVAQNRRPATPSVGSFSRSRGRGRARGPGEADRRPARPQSRRGSARRRGRARSAVSRRGRRRTRRGCRGRSVTRPVAAQVDGGHRAPPAATMRSVSPCHSAPSALRPWTSAIRRGPSPWVCVASLIGRPPRRTPERGCAGLAVDLGEELEDASLNRSGWSKLMAWPASSMTRARPRAVPATAASACSHGQIWLSRPASISSGQGEPPHDVAPVLPGVVGEEREGLRGRGVTERRRAAEPLDEAEHLRGRTGRRCGRARRRAHPPRRGFRRWPARSRRSRTPSRRR